MNRILFICHGNICRSPMAEVIMKDIVERAGEAPRYEIASAATSREEIGSPIYPPARRTLAAHSLPCPHRAARQITRQEYDHWDYIIAMEKYNLRNILRIIGSDPDDKLRLLMSFAGSDEDIDDPWYSGDFEGVFRQIRRGCIALAEQLRR